jgi:hypothetical protein
MGVFDNILLARNIQGQLENLFFAPNKKVAVVPVTFDVNGIQDETADVNADVIFDYKYKSSVKITENPVESGVIVNDHRIIMPDYVTIEVGFNNIVGIVDVLSNLDTTTLIQAGQLLLFGNRFDAKSRVAAKYTDLKIAMLQGDTFDLITPFGIFPDMLIHDIDAAQDSDTISVFRGTVSYRRLIKYDVETTSLATIAGVNPPKARGYQVPKRVTGSLIPSGLRF